MCTPILAQLQNTIPILLEEYQIHTYVVDYRYGQCNPQFHPGRDVLRSEVVSTLFHRYLQAELLEH